jgi:hypothetical protein
LRWSGAAILGGKISIATVNKDADGHWSLDKARSREFDLAERSQAAIRQLQSTLDEFLRRSHISRIYLRTPSGGREYRAKPQTSICEGILCLRGGVQVHHVPASGLTRWMREQGYDLDQQSRNRGWHFAAAAAIYAAENLQEMRDARRAAARASP